MQGASEETFVPVWKLDNGIRRERITANKSQGEVAAAAGLSQRLLSAYELGETSPPLEALRKIAEALECTVPALTEADSRAFAHRRVGRTVCCIGRRRRDVK